MMPPPRPVRAISAVVCLAIASVWTTASAGPFRWQAADGTRIEAEIVAPPDEPARLEIKEPSTSSVELPRSEGVLDLHVHGVGDDLVIAGSRAAWRLAWNNGGFRVSASHIGDKLPPWSRPPTITNYQIAFDVFRQLLRFEGTVPGLDRFFGDGLVTVQRNTDASEKLAGTALLARWKVTGFPLVRGATKGAGERCTSLPENLWWYRDRVPSPANDRSGPRLAAACFNKDLTLSFVKVTAPR